jgi:PAS domain S-box-containing protein
MDASAGQVTPDDLTGMRLLVEHSSDLLARHDPDGVYRYVSPSCRRLLGYEPAALLGRSAYDLIHPEDIAAVERSHRGVLAGEQEAIVVYRIRHRRGAFVWFETTAYPLRDLDSGEVIEIHTASRDVTARETAAAHLRESERRFRLSMANAPIGMALVGLDGRFIEVNDRLCQILGRPRNELVRLAFQDITHRDDLDTDLGYAAQLLTGEISHYELEKRYLLPSGGVVWALLSGSLVRDDEDRPLHFIAQIVDISERQRVLQDLERTGRELERSNAELERYASVVAHDLRSPLATVSGFLELLAVRYGDELDEQGRRFIEVSRRVTRQMAESIEGLLTLTRADTDELVEEVVELGDVLDEAVAAVAPELEGADAQLTAGSLPAVRGDRAQLRLLFQNLLSNAVKFRDPARRLEVSVSADPAPPYWHVVVADNGRGFDPADREIMFAPFSRTKEGYRLGTTGIGLATCKRIVERHGGRIDAIPTDPGARFEFSLPDASIRDGPGCAP